MIDIYKLCLVFGVIIFILSFKKPLFLAIIGGLITSIFIYNIEIPKAIEIVFEASISSSTINVILSFYSITFLQRMLEKRLRLKQAQESLNGIFNNRRINSSLSPAVIGLLPSAGALGICATMVDESCEDYLDNEDKTFVTSFFRHIPESFLPTYSSIILAITLSGVSTSSFVIAMLPMVLVSFLLGYWFYLRKIPKDTGIEESLDKKKELVKYSKSIWTIVLTILLILAFNLPVYIATLIVIVLNFFVDNFSIKEILPMFTSAFEKVIVFNTILIMMFKDIITYTEVINRLPDFFSQFQIPIGLVFALIFFFGTIVSGSQAIIALCMPMAVASFDGDLLPLVVMLMCFSYAAMQISPTHICLFIATEHFNTTLGQLIKRTLPIISIFCVIVLIYTYFLTIIL